MSVHTGVPDPDTEDLVAAHEHAGLHVDTAAETDIPRVAARPGANIPIRLRHVLGGLDRHGTRLVTDAVTYAYGT